MEQNFQTSFIPKKPMVTESAVSARYVSFFLVLSIFIFFAVLLATGGLYFYQKILNTNIAQMENDLNLAKSRFEPSKIAELKMLDKRLKASTDVLTHHIAVSPIFSALQSVTLKTVQFTKFDYTAGDSSNPIVFVKMKGMADGYRAVALQSDLFAQNKNLHNPIFSNLTLDDKGNVQFDLEFTVDLSFVDYKQTLLTQN